MVAASAGTLLASAPTGADGVVVAVVDGVGFIVVLDDELVDEPHAAASSATPATTAATENVFFIAFDFVTFAVLMSMKGSPCVSNLTVFLAPPRSPLVAKRLGAQEETPPSNFSWTALDTT